MSDRVWAICHRRFRPRAAIFWNRFLPYFLRPIEAATAPGFRTLPFSLRFVLANLPPPPRRILFLQDLRRVLAAIYFNRFRFGSDAFGLGLLQLAGFGLPARSAPLGVDEEWPPVRFVSQLRLLDLTLLGIVCLR